MIKIKNISSIIFLLLPVVSFAAGVSFKVGNMSNHPIKWTAQNSDVTNQPVANPLNNATYTFSDPKIDSSSSYITLLDLDSNGLCSITYNTSGILEVTNYLGGKCNQIDKLHMVIL